MKLYQLSSDLAQLETELELAEDDSQRQAALARFDSAAMAFEQKAAGVIAVLRHLETDVETLKREEERLREIRKSREAARGRLREYVAHCLQVADVPKVKTPLGTLYLQTSRPRVEVVDINVVPDAYIKIKIERTVDKELVVDRYTRDGEIIPGVQVVEGEKHLRVR